MMERTPKQVRETYNRVAILYNIIEWPMERLFFHKWRKRLLSDLKGNVLEVGVGTGKNLPYYNYSKISLTATDISNKMMNKARKNAKKYGYPVKFLLVDSDILPFKDNDFDIIVCTFLLCSVPDPKTMLNEMKRVLKKDGKIVMLEHMLSRNKFIAFIENLHNPITRRLFGFSANRDTTTIIRECGLRITKEKNLAVYDVFKELGVHKDSKERKEKQMLRMK